MNFESIRSKMKSIEEAMKPASKTPLGLLLKITRCQRGEKIEITDEEMQEICRYARMEPMDATNGVDQMAIEPCKKFLEAQSSN